MADGADTAAPPTADGKVAAAPPTSDGAVDALPLTLHDVVAVTPRMAGGAVAEALLTARPLAALPSAGTAVASPSADAWAVTRAAGPFACENGTRDKYDARDAPDEAMADDEAYSTSATHEGCTLARRGQLVPRVAAGEP